MAFKDAPFFMQMLDYLYTVCVEIFVGVIFLWVSSINKIKTRRNLYATNIFRRTKMALLCYLKPVDICLPNLRGSLSLNMKPGPESEKERTKASRVLPDLLTIHQRFALKASTLLPSDQS